MIDIHSHVLPCMDDGSTSVKESIRMLAESARQGIQVIAATPHFYPTENGIEEFLERRDEAENKLRAAWKEECPRLLPGAEVYYFRGMSRAEGLEKLRIQETDLLLLEMPFERWNDRMLAEVAELQAKPGIQVLLAHIERYLRLQKDPGIWEELFEIGIRMQCNASFFLNWRTRHKAMKMLRQGKIFLLGSDSHNMAGRPPRLGEVMKMLKGSPEYEILTEHCMGVFGKAAEEKRFMTGP